MLCIIICGSSLSNYAYQTPTIVDTQIRINKQSDTKRLYFKRDSDLTCEAITISLDEGTTCKPLEDISGTAITTFYLT